MSAVKFLTDVFLAGDFSSTTVQGFLKANEDSFEHNPTYRPHDVEELKYLLLHAGDGFLLEGEDFKVLYWKNIDRSDVHMVFSHGDRLIRFDPHTSMFIEV